MLQIHFVHFIGRWCIIASYQILQRVTDTTIVRQTAYCVLLWITHCYVKLVMSSNSDFNCNKRFWNKCCGIEIHKEQDTTVRCAFSVYASVSDLMSRVNKVLCLLLRFALTLTPYHCLLFEIFRQVERPYATSLNFHYANLQIY